MVFWITGLKKYVLKINFTVSFYLLMWLLENLKLHKWLTPCFDCTATLEETRSVLRGDDSHSGKSEHLLKPGLHPPPAGS